MSDCGRDDLYEKNDHNNEVEKEEEYWMLRAMQLASSSTVPRVMQTVMDMGVLEIISKAGSSEVSSDEIASQLELKANTTTLARASSMLDRMLYLLAAHSILTCTYKYTTATTTTSTTNNAIDLNEKATIKRRRLYGLSPIAKYFTPNTDGISLRPFMSLIQDKVYMDSWPGLKPAVLEGGVPFNRVHGMNTFDYSENDLRFNELFTKAMINQATNVITKMLHTYKGFNQIRQIVDVGGNLGGTLELITSKYPHIKGINFDLPHVIQHAPCYPGVEHVTGDMFESVPSGDAILMKSIPHDWSDDHCLKLLRNCYKSLPEKGILIVVEGTLPVVPTNTHATQGMCQIDVLMMIQTVGGKERTEQEFLSLATAAGFAGIRFECYVYNYWVMEVYK